MFVTVAMAVVALTGGIAYASGGGGGSGQNGTINFCFQKNVGNLRVANGPGQCRNSETEWDVDPSHSGTQGPPGPAGPAGPAGPTGLAGPIGLTGAAGPIGPSGAIGAKGDTGAPGPTGPTGDTGAQGGPGLPGPTGPKGDPGAQGDAGQQGPVGPKGDTGPAGTDGAPGQTGPAGSTGATGATGAQGPKGEPGAQGPAGKDGVVHFTVRSVDLVIPAGGQTGLTVRCNAGESVTGGGVRFVSRDANIGDAVLTTHPDTDTNGGTPVGWRSTIRNGDGNAATARFSVICAS
jgi:hypothetical protein